MESIRCKISRENPWSSIQGNNQLCIFQSLFKRFTVCQVNMLFKFWVDTFNPYWQLTILTLGKLELHWDWIRKTYCNGPKKINFVVLLELNMWLGCSCHELLSRSVNRDILSKLESSMRFNYIPRFYAYFEEMHTSCTFLNDTTSVNILSLVLLASNIKIQPQG